MTGGHGVGLDVGDVEAVAILQSSDAPSADPPAVVAPATLRVSPTAAMLGAPPDEPGVLGRLVAAVGDPAGVTAEDGTVYLAEDLLATAMASLLATAAQQFPAPSGEPTVMTTHPAHWSDDQVSALRAALDRVGSWSVRLIPDAVAAVAWFEAVHGAQGESTVAVCDFGATGLTVSLVRTGYDPHLLPPATFAPQFGGDSFDDTVTEHVLGAAAPDLGAVDPRDPQVRADLDRLRAQCRTAKEQLASADEVTVPVAVGGAASEVTVTRHEFDEMLRGPLEGALSLVGETLRAHELDAGALRAILLTGGGAAIPLLGELTGSLPAPAVLAPHPRRTAAHGAAIAAAGSTAFATTVAMPIAAADGGADGVDGDADTDRLPVVSAYQAPGAFTQASTGTPVRPAAATPLRPTRARWVLAAAGTLAALMVAVVVAVAVARDGDTAYTSVYVVPSPSTTTKATTTTTTTTISPRPTTTDTAPRTTESTLAPSTPVLPPPVTTTAAAVPPAVTTAVPPAAATTTEDTTRRPRRTTEEDETTTTTTTTSTTTDTTATTPDEEGPAPGPGDDTVTEPTDNP